MKTLASILLIFTMTTVIASPTTDPFVKAMKTGKQMLTEAQTSEDFNKAANHFARVAATEMEKWLPTYYAAFSYTMTAAVERDPKLIDLKLDAAQEYLDNLKSMEHNKAESHALQGLVYSLRIGVDPANRGQKFSGLSGRELKKAEKIEPDNPRVLHLLAQLHYGTAMFFGSDFSEACDLNTRALEIFNETVPDEDSIEPDWGKGMAEEFQGRCNSR